ncbi:MAG: hypothetical protein ACLUD4_09900 [Thomasclavelia spiroformis]
MKVKIMAGNDLDKLAEEINYFIKNKNVIDIKFSSLCLPTEMENGDIKKISCNDRVLIMYNKKAKELEQYKIAEKAEHETLKRVFGI